ncbi:MAG: tRNA (uridine(54)-C5)-methyltransferase TrmA [Halarcobacter sp.]
MNCKYFGECGSCTLYEMSYEEQLLFKKDREKNRFLDLTNIDFDVIKSETQNFRYRAEFRIWKNFDDEDKPTLSYAMTSFDKKIVEIDSCEIVSKQIKELMPVLLKKIQENKELSFKLYAIEFLTSTTGDILVTLIYHKKLEHKWEIEAKLLEKELNISIIGRSRGQKLVLNKEFIEDTICIKEKDLKFYYQEGGFTQPNSKVNIKMIEWVLDNIDSSENDLCELYCGGGNFTIPLSFKFKKVLATEISKTSIKSAKINCDLNNIKNIDFIRMSSEEFVEALQEKRVFNRLKGLDLKSYNFSTIFMDPPRAGLDDTTRDLAKDFEQIIYISCNPETLHRDLKILSKTHKIAKFALFDQFAYTNHIESGVILNKI